MLSASRRPLRSSIKEMFGMKFLGQRERGIAVASPGENYSPFPFEMGAFARTD